MYNEYMFIRRKAILHGMLIGEQVYASDVLMYFYMFK